ncbi:MAG: hypothetical protein GX660_13355, partial [Clostridiaceae bacterium]|nr:hypothetical protein [Clostridiaceae bacterium]
MEKINMINIMADKIRFVREEHKSVIKVAKDFVVNDQTIRNWLYAIQKKHKLYAKRKR